MKIVIFHSLVNVLIRYRNVLKQLKDLSSLFILRKHYVSWLLGIIRLLAFYKFFTIQLKPCIILTFMCSSLLSVYDTALGKAK